MKRTLKVNSTLIKQLRESREISQEELVRFSQEDGGASISRATLARMETQPTERFQPEQIQTVARILEVPADALSEAPLHQAPTICSPVHESRVIFDKVLGSEHIRFEVEKEPENSEPQRAFIDFISLVKFLHNDREKNWPQESIFENIFKIKNILKILELNEHRLFMGNYFMLMPYDIIEKGFKCKFYDVYTQQHADWVDANSPDFADHTDGCMYVKTTIFILGNLQDEIIIRNCDTNPWGWTMLFEREEWKINASRASQGERPLTFAEIKEMHSEL